MHYWGKIFGPKYFVSVMGFTCEICEYTVHVLTVVMVVVLHVMGCSNAISKK